MNEFVNSFSHNLNFMFLAVHVYVFNYVLYYLMNVIFVYIGQRCITWVWIPS